MAIFFIVLIFTYLDLLNAEGMAANPSGLPGRQLLQPRMETLRKLASVADPEFHPLSILLDYSLSDELSDESSFFLKEIVLKPVVDFFKKLVRVQGSGVIPSFTDCGCFNASLTPEVYKSGVIPGDLLLFVSVRPLSGNVNAYANSCGLDKKTGRPVIGEIVINSAYLRIAYQEVERIRSSLMHEINHVLAFDSELYGYFPSGNGRLVTSAIDASSSGNVTRYTSVMPDLVRFASEYFNCPALEGMPMEDGGGSMSINCHFDQSIIGNELMSPEAYGRPTLSMLTIIFLNSTGWYQTDPSLAEDFDYNKEKGCPVQKVTKETAGAASCSKSTGNRCSPSLLGKNLCIQSAFNYNLPQLIPVEHFRCSNQKTFVSTSLFEVPSNISRCFEVESAGVSAAGCYPVICKNNIPSVYIDQSVYTCKSSSDVLTYKDLSVKCSDFSRLCAQPLCPEDCNGNGVCLRNGTCSCYLFSSGIACQDSEPCTYPASICEKLKPRVTPSSTQIRKEMEAKIASMMPASKAQIIKKSSDASDHVATVNSAEQSRTDAPNTVAQATLQPSASNGSAMSPVISQPVSSSNAPQPSMSSPPPPPPYPHYSDSAQTGGSDSQPAAEPQPSSSLPTFSETPIPDSSQYVNERAPANDTASKDQSPLSSSVGLFLCVLYGSIYTILFT
jgi:leishmanolysin